MTSNTTLTKRIHGEPAALWQRLNLQQEPPVQCDFKVGDCVEFTNDYGVKYIDFVIGFSEDANFHGRFVHISPSLTASGEPTDAWWFPHKPSELRSIATASKLATQKYTLETLAPVA